LKSFLIIPLLLLLIVTPAFGQMGLLNRFDVETGGYTFEIKTVSNFDVLDHEFDKDEKRLTIFINSSLENNLGEIIIPQSLLGGNFTFYLNDMQYYPEIKSNDKISFITLNFTGMGNNKIDIIATETFAQSSNQSSNIISQEKKIESSEKSIVEYGLFVTTLGLMVLVFIGIPVLIIALMALKFTKRLPEGMLKKILVVVGILFLVLVLLRVIFDSIS